MKTLLATLSLLVLFVTSAAAQTAIPPPSGPLVFCGVQSSPVADSYKLVFDGGAEEDVTMTPASSPGAATTFCQSALPTFTHSFALPAARFPVGTHTVKIVPRNAFGPNTNSSVFTVVIGVAPGDFTTGAVGVVEGAQLRTRPAPVSKRGGGR